MGIESRRHKKKELKSVMRRKGVVNYIIKFFFFFIDAMIWFIFWP
jgi:hypothetical protein